ncbi:MAG: hypothetical protein KF773_06235 [Deltaproteobacteria bacterium]|nr:hypothetical protein [Deltaproteobacteria bacterium]MCW5809152.1 hypothetical protein [Deltaproteobacteria bacterium]
MHEIRDAHLAHVTGGRADPKAQLGALTAELRGITAKLTGQPQEAPPAPPPKRESPSQPLSIPWSGATIGAHRNG